MTAYHFVVNVQQITTQRVKLTVSILHQRKASTEGVMSGHLNRAKMNATEDTHTDNWLGVHLSI